VIHCLRLFVPVVYDVFDTDTATIFSIQCRIVLGNLLHEPVVCVTAVEKFGNEMLVHNMAHECLAANYLTMTLVEMQQ
jgi:hypothetical protein